MVSESGRGASRETAFVEALLAAECDLSVLLDAEICAVLDELSSRRRVIDAALVDLASEVLRRADESSGVRSLPRKVGYRSLVEMLQFALGVRRGEARAIESAAEATRTRTALTGAPVAVRFPQLARALRSGLLSISQASAITRGLGPLVARVDPQSVQAAEAELVDSACGLTPDDDVPAIPEALSAQASAWEAFLDPEGEEPRAERIASARGLWITRRTDGAIAGRFVATPEQGEVLLNVFDAITSPRRAPRFVETSCVEPAADLPAEGAAEIAVESAAEVADGGVETDGVELGSVAVGSGTPSGVGAADGRSLEQQRMDALEMIFAGFAASPDAPRAGGEAPTIVITTTPAGLAGEASRPRDVPHLERTGAPVSASYAAKVLCDAFVRVASLTAKGEVLALGRKQRLFTVAQRRAIAARDRSCRAAGCVAPVRWCETHHTTPWSEGGRTDVSDGVLLCSYHHHEVHRGNLRLVRGESALWRAVPDGGHRVLKRRRRRQAPVRAAGSTGGRIA